MTIRLLSVAVFTILLASGSGATNLLINGGAESGDLTGWEDPLGNGFEVLDPPTFDPVEGSFVFYAGVVGASGPLVNEVRQDLDVSDLAGSIDAGEVTSGFSGWGRTGASADGSVRDPATIILEFLASDLGVLAQYSSGEIEPYNTWVQIGDTRAIPPGTRVLRVRLIGQRDGGISTDAYFDDLMLSLDGPPAGVADQGGSPVLETARLEVFPNPFNPLTTISFTSSEIEHARLQVMDLRGRLVATLVDGVVATGRHEVNWDGRDAAGREVPSGVYVSRLVAGGRVSHGRMALVR
jgi:hypothetical protein